MSLDNEKSGEAYPPPPIPKQTFVFPTYVNEVKEVKEVKEEVKEEVKKVKEVKELKEVKTIFVYRNHTFINAKITINENTHIKFIKCIFIDCQLNGNYTMKNCQSKDHCEQTYNNATPAFKIEQGAQHVGYISIMGNITKKNKYYNYINKYL
jgi:hypothetical protein